MCDLLPPSGVMSLQAYLARVLSRRIAELSSLYDNLDRLAHHEQGVNPRSKVGNPPNGAARRAW